MLCFKVQVKIIKYYLKYKILFKIFYIIDEILYSNYAKAVIARISENYCIIKQDSIDDIVKFSKKYETY